MDLSSTHGTRVNKLELEKDKWLKLNTGDLIKFAHSTRLYILHGPVEDNTTTMTMSRDEISCNWGFKNDAYEGDEWGGINVTGHVDRSIITS